MSSKPGWRERLARVIMPKSVGGAMTPFSAPLDSESKTLLEVILGKQPAQRNTEQLIASYKQVPEFRAVVNKIADHVAAVHWRIYAVKAGGKGQGKEYKRTRAGSIGNWRQRQKELSRYDSLGELEEIVDHPMAEMLDVANSVHSGFEERKIVQIYLDIVGESFERIQRDKALGHPIGLWPVPPHWVAGTPTAEKPFYELKINGKTSHVSIEDMIWTRDLDPLNPYSRGSGFGEALGDEIDTSDYAAKYLKSFFYNRTKPDLIIGAKGASADAIEIMSQKFQDQHRGYHRTHRSFWTSNDLSVHELNSNFGELQITDLKGRIRDSFVNTYGIPPEVLGILTNSNKATIGEAFRIFAEEVVVPRCERLREKKQQRLATEYDERLIITYDSPVPTDDDFELAAMQAAPYMATRGEWRQMQGLRHRGEIDDVHFVPVGMIEQPVERTGKAAKQMASSTKEPLLLVDKSATQEQVDLVLEALAPKRMISRLEPIMTQGVDDWGNEALEDAGISMAFDILNPLTEMFFADWADNRIVGITETTRRALNATLIDGFSRGEGIRELSKRVTVVMEDAKKYRAERIARTEVLRASNHATYAAYKTSGVPMLKEWVATLDNRVRDEHAALHGEQADLDEPFESGGATAMHPGDFGVPELDINCRCTMVSVIDKTERSKEQIEEIWKQFDRRLIPWENAMIDGISKAFDDQRRDLIARIIELIQE